MKSLHSLLFLVCLFFSAKASALRCDHQLVEIGDFKDDVIAICGEPDSVETHTEVRGISNYANAQQNFGNNNRNFPSSSFGYGQENYRATEIMVEEWIYNFGRSRLKQHLRFENGVLKEVRNLGRGR